MANLSIKVQDFEGPLDLLIHLIEKEDEFINTLKLIFENKIRICTECNICKTYKMINNIKISK